MLHSQLSNRGYDLAELKHLFERNDRKWELLAFSNQVSLRCGPMCNNLHSNTRDWYLGRDMGVVTTCGRTLRIVSARFIEFSLINHPTRVTLLPQLICVQHDWVQLVSLQTNTYYSEKKYFDPTAICVIGRFPFRLIGISKQICTSMQNQGIRTA